MSGPKRPASQRAKIGDNPAVERASQPAVPPEFPLPFPLGAGRGAVTVACALHRMSPDSSSHVDFFIGPATARDRDARVARTFRLPLAACAGGRIVAGSFDAVELPPHRAEYLALDGPRELTDGRGRVEPIFARDGRAAASDGEFEARWEHWIATGRRVAGERWTIHFAPDST